MALRSVTSWASIYNDLGLLPNYVVLVLAMKVGILIVCKVARDWIDEARGFDFEYPSNIQLRFMFYIFPLHTYVYPKG